MCTYKCIIYILKCTSGVLCAFIDAGKEIRSYAPITERDEKNREIINIKATMEIICPIKAHS